MTDTNPNREVATVAGGCFWCLQPIFQDLRGVEKVEVGYSGGHLANPSYEAVCTDTTGHAEAVQVTFDPAGRFALPRLPRPDRGGQHRSTASAPAPTTPLDMRESASGCAPQTFGKRQTSGEAAEPSHVDDG